MQTLKKKIIDTLFNCVIQKFKDFSENILFIIFFGECALTWERIQCQITSILLFLIYNGMYFRLPPNFTFLPPKNFDP